MRIEHFRYLFGGLDGFYLTNNVLMFRRPIEIWNAETGESATFRTVDEALDHVIDGETVRSIIERSDALKIELVNGGRGASDGSGTFKFGHAGGGAGGSDTQLLPAYANTKIKSKSLEGALAEFKRNHLLSDHEWAYEVDDQGFVHQYVEGQAHSVGIWSSRNARGSMIIHNHPSGGAFSDSDLLSVSMQRRTKGIIASGKNYDYTFKKGTHFDASGFMKAVKTAQMKGKDYDDAVDKWLRKNQRKYGYTYSRSKN